MGSDDSTPSAGGDTKRIEPAVPLPVVGLIPAAGRATRLGPLTGSKELLPVPTGDPAAGSRAAADYLVAQMAKAGCARAFFIVRSGKWDIAEHFGHGAVFGMPIGYLMMDAPYGPPFTIAQAFPFVGDAGIITGFPDILIEPDDAAARVVAHLRASSAQVVLATFPCGPGVGCDMAEAGPDQVVTRIVPKENDPVWKPDSRTWLLAAWRPTFTAFFARTIAGLARVAEAMPSGSKPEWPMGAVLVAALAQGVRIECVHFPDGRFLDIGTPERLAQAARFFGSGAGACPADGVSP